MGFTVDVRRWFQNAPTFDCNESCGGRPKMNNTTIHVGLDVHKKTTAVAVSQGPGRARFIGMIDSNPRALLKVLGKLGNAREMSVVWTSQIRPPLKFNNAIGFAGRICALV